MMPESGLFSSAVEIMSTPVTTVTPDTTIHEAVVLLENELRSIRLTVLQVALKACRGTETIRLGERFGRQPDRSGV